MAEKLTAPFHGADDPAKLNEFVAQAADMAKSKFPVPAAFSSDLVALPGGLIINDSGRERVVTTGQVRELTGADEEALGRALSAENPYHVMNTVLEHGVVKLGEEKPEDTRELLKGLLIGDRDALMIGVRAATYGSEIEVKGWACPNCGEKIDATFDLMDDVETRSLKNPREAEFDVKLRKGSVAHVKLPTGEDQFAVGELAKRPLAERNTKLLERCVETITDADGQMNIMIAAPYMARDMGMADRKKVIDEMTKRQPGPSYNAVKFTHETCGKEVALAFDLGDLFFS
jgi:hypothetical protein